MLSLSFRATRRFIKVLPPLKWTWIPPYCHHFKTFTKSFSVWHYHVNCDDLGMVNAVHHPVNMLTVIQEDGPAFHTRSKMKQDSVHPNSSPPHIEPDIPKDPSPTPKSLSADKLDTLLQMQCMNPFCKCISKQLINGTAPKHETDTFTYSKGLLYKHITDSGKRFLGLVIPKSWRCTVLIEAHDKPGHQGNTHTYCLIKRQYYWKGMNKDICKYIAACALCHREKEKAQLYPLQMTYIPDRPFDKIAIDLIIECDTSTSGNKHILTIIDQLTGWPEAYPIPDKTADTIVSTFIKKYLPVHMCP